MMNRLLRIPCIFGFHYLFPVRNPTRFMGRPIKMFRCPCGGNFLPNGELERHDALRDAVREMGSAK